jgi:hypothetical protein
VITLKPAMFASGTVVLMPSWVGTGHWMVRRSFVTNATKFESAAAAQAAAGVQRSKVFEKDMLAAEVGLSDRVHRWRTTQAMVNAGKLSGRVVASEKTGDLAAIDTRLLKLIGKEGYGHELWGSANDSAFMDGATFDATNVVLMPMRLGIPCPCGSKWIGPRPPGVERALAVEKEGR